MLRQNTNKGNKLDEIMVILLQGAALDTLLVFIVETQLLISEIDEVRFLG